MTQNVSMNPLPLVSRLVQAIRRLEIEAVHNIPRRGAALIAATHSSPLDFFYYLALMRRVGRSDHRFVAAAEIVAADEFRPYVKAALRAGLPGIGEHLGFVADALSHVIPPWLRQWNPIPVHRKGDDSEARRQSLECLLSGHLLTIAPGTGDDSYRDSQGMRPLTYGVASIAYRYFDATAEPLAVVPLAIKRLGRGTLAKVRMRVGSPFYGMSDREYPDLFADIGHVERALRHEAYQHFTKQLTLRMSALL